MLFWHSNLAEMHCIWSRYSTSEFQHLHTGIHLAIYENHFLEVCYTVCATKMQQKYNGMSDVECETNIDNIGMVWKIHLSTLKWDIKRSNLIMFTELCVISRERSNLPWDQVCAVIIDFVWMCKWCNVDELSMITPLPPQHVLPLARYTDDIVSPCLPLLS